MHNTVLWWCRTTMIYCTILYHHGCYILYYMHQYDKVPESFVPTPFFSFYFKNNSKRAGREFFDSPRGSVQNWCERRRCTCQKNYYWQNPKTLLMEATHPKTIVKADLKWALKLADFFLGPSKWSIAIFIQHFAPISRSFDAAMVLFLPKVCNVNFLVNSKSLMEILWVLAIS